MRFTLLKAFVAVTFVALACAGMMYRTAGWASGLLTLSLALFTVMALRAISLRGADRVFALVFAAVGCVYLLLATSNVFSGVRESLFTNYPLAYAARALPDTGANGWSSYTPAYMPPPMVSFAPAISASSVAVPNPLPNDATDEGAESGAESPAVSTTPAEPPTAEDTTFQPPTLSSPSVYTGSGAMVVQSTSVYATPVTTQAMPIEAVIAEGTSLASSYSPYGTGSRVQKFFQIGHCVWSWLFALLAGWFAAWMYGRKSVTATG